MVVTWSGLGKDQLVNLINCYGEHELRIDLDGQDSFNSFLERTFLVRRSLGLVTTDVAVYRTKNGYHVFIQVENALTRYEVLLIQSLLGDDYKHTLAGYNQLRYACPPTTWNVLFREKFYLNRVGQVYQASCEEYDPELSQKVERFLSSGEANDQPFGEEEQSEQAVINDV